jgi:hypothetical protein
MKTTWILVLLALVATPATAGRKFGKQVRYAGVHPVAKHEGGGMCHIEAPHVHVYPANKLEYRVHADNNVFVGDPVAYGWDGPKYSYKGHHPVQVHVIAGGDPYTHYCYLDGPHYHAWEPPDGPDFKVAGNAYFYVGEPAPLYLEARPAYIGINATYRPIVYTRPVVEVEPPAGWIGITVGGPAVVVEPAPVVVVPRGRARVVGPGVHVGAEVHVPVPSVSIGVHVGGPAVIVKEKHHHHGKHKHKKWKGRR